MEHIVRFMDDPHSPDAREIRWHVTGSMSQALTLAASEWPVIRDSHGPRAGYVIEDGRGRRVLVMPLL